MVVNRHRTHTEISMQQDMATEHPQSRVVSRESNIPIQGERKHAAELVGEGTYLRGEVRSQKRKVPVLLTATIRRSVPYLSYFSSFTGIISSPGFPG